MEPVVVRLTGKLIPHIGMYSRRSIQKGEELTFMYGSPNAGKASRKVQLAKFDDTTDLHVSHRARPSSCGTAACLGYLPCDSTGYTYQISLPSMFFFFFYE